MFPCLFRTHGGYKRETNRYTTRQAIRADQESLCPSHLCIIRIYSIPLGA
jgi:hypothetical protein